MGSIGRSRSTERSTHILGLFDFFGSFVPMASLYSSSTRVPGTVPLTPSRLKKSKTKVFFRNGQMRWPSWAFFNTRSVHVQYLLHFHHAPLWVAHTTRHPKCAGETDREPPKIRYHTGNTRAGSRSMPGPLQINPESHRLLTKLHLLARL